MSDALARRAAAPLSGYGVSLEPLERAHLDELVRITDDEIWRYQPCAPGPLPHAPDEHRDWLERWFATTLMGMEAGTDIAFAVRRTSDGVLVGSTRYLAIVWPHRRVEIGGTYYSADARGTKVNPACKRLLLARAFDELNCQRVELKCDERNTPSRRSILGLGAVQEGIFRQHMLLGDGHRRNTVYFSITDEEWPAVRARLDARLNAE